MNGYSWAPKLYTAFKFQEFHCFVMKKYDYTLEDIIVASKYRDSQ
jgi:hypothetical protein